MLQLNGITKRYTTGHLNQIALNKVSLNFRRNEFVAILGPSGSGKTTLLNVIGGLEHYDSGDLVINGRSTKHFKDADWDAYRNNSVGFVFQSYHLITHLSIIDNVELGMTLSGISAETRHKKAIEVLTKVGLKEHVHKMPPQLSTGQVQRAAIARALANEPDIIIADDPTCTLDSSTSTQIMDLIRDIADDKLVIMVTQNTELAEKYADRIIRLEAGTVVEDSHPFNLAKAESSYQLKRTHMRFTTALKLSGKHLSIQKWRFSLTALASGISNIGIALILNLYSGFWLQINQNQYSNDMDNYILDTTPLVLMVFAAFALVVSFSMISIITYISVLKRTHEIGVLRALGARKKDIARLFNIENFFIGAFSGLLGIVIAYLLTILINRIIENQTELANAAQLNPAHTLLALTLNIALTLTGGAIPAKLAARKTPAAAMRAE